MESTVAGIGFLIYVFMTLHGSPSLQSKSRLLSLAFTSFQELALFCLCQPPVCRLLLPSLLPGGASWSPSHMTPFTPALVFAWNAPLLTLLLDSLPGLPEIISPCVRSFLCITVAPTSSASTPLATLHSHYESDPHNELLASRYLHVLDVSLSLL